jgi:uncharacterized protein YdeI (YjbR/CyaY-like superfamily)
MPPAAKPTFFETPAAFRAWLEKHHETAEELLVGFRRVGSGRPSITWPQSVDEALCFGWIDGVRRTLDADSYTIRFTPRRSTSTWSAINIAKVAELRARGLMKAAGLAAFDARSAHKSKTYSYEQTRVATLAPAHEKEFQSHKKAWEFFKTQAPSYQKRVVHWISTAKKEEVRAERLARAIAASKKAKRL